MERRAIHVDVHREDGSYWAEVRELPGCFAAGDTMAEVIESAQHAVRLYLSTADDEPGIAALELAGLDLSLVG
jgi:predicted RNase H-like HicB family nuclease